MSDKKGDTPSLTKVDSLIARIVRIAKGLGKTPHDLTRTDIMDAVGENSISEWELRKHGGLRAVVTGHFPDETVDQVAKRTIAKRRNYLSGLERKVADLDYFSQSLERSIREVLATNPINAGPVVKGKFVKPSIKSDIRKREIVAIVSDVHFGLEIEESEIPGNAYNWQIAARRMAMFAEQIGSYKIEHRADTPRLRLLIIGDLIAGVIHLDDSGIDVLTNQFRGTVDILVQFIDYLRKFYKEIIIETTPGNHDRVTHKGFGRPFAQKWDSYSSMIMIAVAAAYRNVEDVRVNMPKTPFADFEVLGRRFFATHGDGVINMGNPSNSINIANISRQIDKLNGSDIVGTGKKFSVVIGGHVHRPLSISLENGVEVVINGTLSGTDGFAQTIGVFSSQSVQTVFEATAEHPLGDYRRIYCDDASDDTYFDRIIKPWSGNLEFNDQNS